jgi:hypothetical protein
MGNSNNKKNRGRKPLGMIGCGTPEIMLRAAVRKHLSSIRGVVSADVGSNNIKLLVTDGSVEEAVRAVAPDMTFQGRQILIVVETSKRDPRRRK